MFFTFWSCLHHYLKMKSIKISHKRVEVKVFLTILAWWWKDLNPDPYLRILLFSSVTFKMPTKNNIFSKSFLFFTFWCCLHHYLKMKSIKIIKSRNQGFSYYFGLMMKGFESGSVPLTKRSGWCATNLTTVQMAKNFHNNSGRNSLSSIIFVMSPYLVQ